MRDGTLPALADFLDEAALADPGLPPSRLLAVVDRLATLLHTRSADPLLQLLALAAHPLNTSAAPAATLPHFADRLAALEEMLAPAAAAVADQALTTREFTIFTRSTAPILYEAARSFELLHWLLAEEASAAEPEALLTLQRLVGLATRYDPDPAKIADLVQPHFRAAVRRAMLPHTAALEVRQTPYEAVDPLIHALRGLAADITAEEEVAEYLPEGYLRMSATMRYRGIAQVRFLRRPCDVDNALPCTAASSGCSVHGCCALGGIHLTACGAAQPCNTLAVP